MGFDFASVSYIAGGMYITLQYAVVSVICGLIVATLLCFCSFSRSALIRYFSRFYVSLFRGTPLLVQLSIVYYGLPNLFAIKLPAFIAGIIAFSLNSGAYMSEVIKAGINAVDKSQFEAAQSLGVPNGKLIRDIILPQAIKNILPALINEVINMLKESAIVSVIGEADIMRRSQIVAAQHYTYFTPLIVAAICYYFLVTILTFSANSLERKLKNERK